jgi:AcrR family transcriptional regulator
MTREESRAETRRRLLDAGERVFAEKGFAGASIEEIAERAGFSSGAFYSNFEDKQELFLALFDRRTQAQIAEVTELLKANPAPSDFFAALKTREAGRGSQRTWLMLTLEFVLYSLRTPAARPRLAQRERAVREAYARAAAAQHKALGLPLPGPPHQLGLILQALDHGLWIEQNVDPEQVPEDAMVDALEFLLKASVALAHESPRTTAGKSK